MCSVSYVTPDAIKKLHLVIRIENHQEEAKMDDNDSLIEADIATNLGCMECNQDNVSLSTGHTSQASVCRLMIKWILDDQNAILEDNKATT